MTVLSKSASYGLRAALFVAARQTQPYVSIRTISDELSISFHFLTKILQKLTRAGIMRSSRGPTGGVRLVKPLADITILDIVEAVEGPDYLGDCVLGLSECSGRNPCPLHADWTKERKRFLALFAATTLNTLAPLVTRNEVRLTG